MALLAFVAAAPENLRGPLALPAVQAAPTLGRSAASRARLFVASGHTRGCARAAIVSLTLVAPLWRHNALRKRAAWRRRDFRGQGAALAKVIVAASIGNEETSSADSAMAGIYVPLAQSPTAPSQIGVGSLKGSPDFAIYAAQVAEQQELCSRVQEVTSRGRQLAYLAIACLQRGDAEGATAAFAAIADSPSLEALMGPERWENLEQRVRLCNSNGVGYFLDVYITALGLQSFIQRGVLTPEGPAAWRVGVPNVDDEFYLIGVIGATRELERYAVNRAQELDLSSIKICLGAAQSLEEALMQFSFRNSDLRQRFDSVKYCVKRLEALAYETDLALQRKEAANKIENHGDAQTEELGPALHGEPTGTATVLELEMIGRIKERYDIFDLQREDVMKRCRDVVKAAKNAIYALQRADFGRADELLRKCAGDASDIHSSVISKYPSLRDGFFSGALEELAEALAYLAFRKDHKLISYDEMQNASGLAFPLSTNEYFGGLLDLTGEVGRFAIRRARNGRQGQADVELSLACVDTVYNGIQGLTSLPSWLGKKVGPLKSTLTKIEGALYELALLTPGMRLRLQANEDNSEEAG